ncbi:MAG: hypothetical protein JOZ81_16970 [Chloroflexi bacterium]|nr:hypothetical protein [Chloroflexota bacterium]
MSYDSALTLLASLVSLSGAQKNLLRAYSIGTVEELAGTLEADPTAVQTLLGLDYWGFRRLRDEVQSVLNQNTALLDEFQRQARRKYSYGGLDPG